MPAAVRIAVLRPKGARGLSKGVQAAQGAWKGEAGGRAETLAGWDKQRRSSEKPHDALTKNPSPRTYGSLRSDHPQYIRDTWHCAQGMLSQQARKLSFAKGPPSSVLFWSHDVLCYPELDKSKWGERFSALPSPHLLTGGGKAGKLEETKAELRNVTKNFSCLKERPCLWASQHHWFPCSSLNQLRAADGIVPTSLIQSR